MDAQPSGWCAKKGVLEMTEIIATLPNSTGGYDMARFNALRHGVLSRYTVLPWEDAEEYRALVAALAAEHAPQGPTEEHLVEEVAGILWRKRRLRLAEAAAQRHGLEATFAPWRNTVRSLWSTSVRSASASRSSMQSARPRPTRK